MISRQLTSLKILVAEAHFSVALATSWSQFRTLEPEFAVCCEGNYLD